MELLEQIGGVVDTIVLAVVVLVLWAMILSLPLLWLFVGLPLLITKLLGMW